MIYIIKGDVNMREKFNEILEKHGIYLEDVEAILNATSEMLEHAADTLKEKEPYATTTIRQLEMAAYEVFNLSSILDD
jgi:uncharacterized DUF497 family protein